MNNEDKSNAEDFTIHPHHDEEETKAWINEPHLLIEIFIGTGRLYGVSIRKRIA